MKRFILIFAGILAFASLPGFAANTAKGAAVIEHTASVTVSSTTAGAAGQGLVITSTPTAGTYSIGQNVYVTHIHIEMYATGTLTGGATPVQCTTTGLSATPVWFLPTAQATGAMFVIDEDHAASPLTASAAATAVVLQCPATASVKWNIRVDYYIDN